MTHARTSATTSHANGDTLVVEPQRFAIVPEWVLDLDIPDAALRLYALLLRYGGTSGSRMPSRRLLAERMRRSVDSVDRAMRDLETAGLVRVEHRRSGRKNLTNRYHLRTTDPAERQRPSAAPQRRPDADQTSDEGKGGSRRSAATRTDAATGTPAARGTAAARVAADLRPNPEQETDSPPPPTPPPRPPRRRARRATAEEEPAARSEQLLARCGITDLPALAQHCQSARQALGLSATRWAGPCLLAAIQLALLRGWPAEQIQPALLILAADRGTRSPMRLAEAGPWWDQPPPTPPGELDGVDLAALEAELDDVAEHRPALQAKARAELAAAHLPVTRATVTARAVQILHRSHQEVA
jgi:hypothetical protein